MESHQRAAIEDLKQQKAKYELLLAELQAQKGCAPAVHAQQQQQAAKLQQLAITYSRKAQEERQLLEQIEEELQKARQQVEQQRKRQSTSPAAAQQGVPAAKCCVALQERLSHKKQQLDEAVSRNKAMKSEVEDLSKRGTAAQQLHDKLTKQLADVATELAKLQELVDTTEQAQQQATALAEELRLHDDAEALALSEAEKQVQTYMLMQQQAGIGRQQAPEPQLLHQQLNRHCGARSACGMAEEEAAAALKQLLGLFDAAGVIPCSCPASSASERTQDSSWQALLQQVQQLRASNAVLFKQCVLANHQLGRSAAQPVTGCKWESGLG